MQGILEALASAGGQGPLASARIAVLFGHAIAIGTVLSLLTAWVTNGGASGGADGKPPKNGDGEVVVGPSNVVFLCVGMTAVMILVNDNLARAFAIGAAIALVRFRIKVASKFLGVGLFYGVLTGMACGVNRLDVAWGVTAVFSVLLAATSVLKRLARRKRPELRVLELPESGQDPSVEKAPLSGARPGA